MLLDQRAVRYVPHGARVGILPHLTLTTTSVADGGALSMSVSETVYGTLPEVFEVGVEVWTGSAWVEGPDARFVVNKSSTDRSDVAGVKTLGGTAFVLWLLNKNSLAGVVPKTVSGISVEPSKVVSDITGSGIELTKPGHGLHSGRRVKVYQKGNADQLSVNSMLWVREPITPNGFRLAPSMETIHAKNVGPAASGIQLAIYKERLIKAGHGFVVNEKIRFSSVGTSALEEDTAYFVRQVGADYFLVSKEIGGLPVTFDESSGITAYRDLDGDRLFKNQTVGQILRDVILEAQLRGWGTSVEMDFTDTRDSRGVLWSTTAATADGLPIGFKPGTSGRQVLNALADAGYIEYETQGRTLRVFNLGSGRQLGLGNQPVRVGDAAISTPTATNLDNLLTDVTIRGDGPILREVKSSAPATPLGRLEQYQLQAGITTSDVATDIGKAVLKRGESPEKELTITENADAARFLPVVHYVRGDWVRVDVNGQAQQMRVAGISISSGEDGTQVSVTLGVVMRDLLVKLAQGQGRLTGGIGTGGAGQVRPVANTRRPAAPLGLLVQSQALFNMDGAASALLAVSFQPVLHDMNGYLLNVTAYQVWVRGEGDEGSTLLGSPTVGATTVGPVPAGRNYYVRVRGRSEWGEWGEFSGEFEVYAAPPVDPPNTPTPPLATSSLGVLHTGWDGKTIDPASAAVVSPPPGFSYWFCEIADAIDGTYSPLAQTLLAAGEVLAAGLTIGSDYWVRAYTVSRLGIPSDPTEPVRVTIEGIKLPDLDTTIQDAINDAVNGAADAAEAATEAAAAANGKNRLFHALIDPDQAGTADGDVWHKWTNMGTSGRLLGTWRWDATAAEWTPTALDATYIPLLDIGQGTFGNMSGQRLEVGTVTANKLLIGDFTNLLDDPTFDVAVPNPAWVQSNTAFGLYTIVTAAAAYPWARELRFTPSATITAAEVGFSNTNRFTCEPGDQFYVKIGVRTSRPGVSGMAGYYIRWTLADGSAAFSANFPMGPNGYLSGTYTAPANAIAGQFVYTVRNGFAGGDSVVFTPAVLRRVNGGELIVDGAVTARHLQADEIWANTAWVNQAKVNVLTAGVVTAGMIDGNAINGKTITGAIVRTAASGARVQIDSAGLRAFNSGGTAVTTISASTGEITALGSFSTGTTGTYARLLSAGLNFYLNSTLTATILAGVGTETGSRQMVISANSGGAIRIGDDYNPYGGRQQIGLMGDVVFSGSMWGDGGQIRSTVSGAVSGFSCPPGIFGVAVSFPAAFSSSANTRVALGANGTANGVMVSTRNVTASGFQLMFSNVTAATAPGQGAHWIAT